MTPEVRVPAFLENCHMTMTHFDSINSAPSRSIGRWPNVGSAVLCLAIVVSGCTFQMPNDDSSSVDTTAPSGTDSGSSSNPPAMSSATSPSTPSTTPPASPPPSDVASSSAAPQSVELSAGAQLFLATGCIKCHAIEGLAATNSGGPPGGPPGGFGGGGGGGFGQRAPNLTHAGSDETHTSDWMAAHIRDPKSHKPQSRMPAYGTDKIDDANLKVLADYLASLK
jgi:mono/diheme cytochrome c family protein